MAALALHDERRRRSGHELSCLGIVARQLRAPGAVDQVGQDALVEKALLPQEQDKRDERLVFAVFLRHVALLLWRAVCLRLSAEEVLEPGPESHGAVPC